MCIDQLLNKYKMRQVRSFVFTLNNYTQETITAILDHFFRARYIVIGKEIGASGTPHLQGYIQLDKRRYLSVIGGLFPWHVEETLGSPVQASEYCKKQGDFIEYGELSTPATGIKRKEEYWKQLLELAEEGKMTAIAEIYPGEYIRNYRNLHAIRTSNMNSVGLPKKCLWLYGKPGTGKSRFAFSINPDSTYAKMANKWWDGYIDQQTIVLDDFGKDHKILGYHLKRWSDRYPAILEIKGTAIPTTYEEFIVTSNYSISDIWNEDEEMCAALKRRFKEQEVFSHQLDLSGLMSIMTNINGHIRLINYKEIFNSELL